MLRPLSMASRQDSWLQSETFHCHCLRASHPSRISSGSAWAIAWLPSVLASQCRLLDTVVARAAVEPTAAPRVECVGAASVADLQKSSWSRAARAGESPQA